MGEQAGGTAARTPREVARELCRRLIPLREEGQRARVLGGLLGGLPPEDIVAALLEVIEGADRREPGADLALRAALDPRMRSSWEAGLELRVLAVARQGGHFDLAGIFLDLPEMDERLREPAPRLPLGLSKVPLGVRRALARRSDIDLLGRLLADPDPAVVAHLLGNPRITAREVVRMAARDPVRQEVLEAIAAHPRWNACYEVRLALAHNPCTPTRITLGLLHLLLTQDLRRLGADGRLSAPVARRAGEILAERRAREGRA